MKDRMREDIYDAVKGELEGKLSPLVQAQDAFFAS